MIDQTTHPAAAEKHCLGCGYNLDGVADRCPECGRAFNADDPSTYGPGKPRPILRQLGPAGVVAGWYFLLPLAGLAVLAWKIKPVAALLKSAGPMSVAGYSLAFAVFSGLALLPTWVQSLIGGWAFGLRVGAPAAILGVAGGAAIGYEIARATASRRVESVIDSRPKWHAVRDALVGRSFWKTLTLVTLVRLPPNSPFAITNLVMGSLRVNRLAHFLGTLIGILPRTTLAVYVGTGLKQLTRDSLSEGPPKWVFVVGMIMLIGVVAVIGQMAKKELARVVGNGKSKPLGPDQF
jgi:uncharacterized membrane protein YdjX (TVP38/TMEM64 family)